MDGDACKHKFKSPRQAESSEYSEVNDEKKEAMKQEIVSACHWILFLLQDSLQTPKKKGVTLRIQN